MFKIHDEKSATNIIEKNHIWMVSTKTIFHLSTAPFYDHAKHVEKPTMWIIQHWSVLKQLKQIQNYISSNNFLAKWLEICT